MRDYLAVSLTRKVSKFKCLLSSTENRQSVRLPTIQTGNNLVSLNLRDNMATANGQLVRTSGSMAPETKVRNWRYKYLSNFNPLVNGHDLPHDKTNGNNDQKVKKTIVNESNLVLPSIKVKPATPLTVTVGGNKSKSPASGKLNFGLFPRLPRTPTSGHAHKQLTLKVS